MTFVKLLVQNDILLSKSNSPLIKQRKEVAAKNISDMWLRFYAEVMTPKQVTKKFHNMKDSLKYKLRMNGNDVTALKEWEKRLADLFNDVAHL